MREKRTSWRCLIELYFMENLNAKTEKKCEVGWMPMYKFQIFKKRCLVNVREK